MAAFLADITVVVHFAALLYIGLGGFLAWVWPKTIFVHVFFAVALTSQALRALRGETPISIAGGIEIASTRAPAIASFAAVTGSIGFVLEVMGR